jgi:hypothetical protein
VSSDARIAAGLFVLAAVTFAYFTGGAGWNQDAHFDLTRAIVERQTLYIDGYDVNTGDVSKGTGGHTFINKPPGASILAAAPYAVIFAIERRLQLSVDSMTRTNRLSLLNDAVCARSRGIVSTAVGHIAEGSAAGGGNRGRPRGLLLLRVCTGRGDSGNRSIFLSAYGCGALRTRLAAVCRFDGGVSMALLRIAVPDGR